MKKNRYLILILIVFTLGLALKVTVANADAFNANRIIDDALFDNTSTMNAAQIDAFLNTFPNSCISTNSGFMAIDPTGYTPSTGYTFGGFVTAGQVIYDASQAYGINPQVIITTLEKEQSLVTGQNNFSGYCNNGDQHKYAAAVGYGCPDSGTTYSYNNVNLYARNGIMVSNVDITCVNSVTKAGFSQQVIRAAWLFKFGEQRSKGNINWAVIKGNWNNSDDPQTCYGGPMTQGTFQRCPSGASTYYDGYTTIDSTAVHMDTGATAALYWYTPHFHGNQIFYTLFTSWFGSTTYKQPVSSMFVSSNQSGKVYFISLNNNTRYFVPSWSTAQAFGLDRYQVMPLDDSVINTYTDGGTLKTLVWDNNDQKMYLVDGQNKYWFQQYCSEWGLDCSNQAGGVSFLTSTYFDTIVNYAGNSKPLMQSGTTIFAMQNGSRQPIANTDSLLALGYNGNQILGIQQADLNAAQPLGILRITTPTFIQFAPHNELFYYDGQNYHYVQDYDTYIQWGGQKVLTPQISSYNTTLPSSTDTLSSWIVDSGNGNHYFIDSGRKVDITTTYTTWSTGSFENLPDQALSSLPSTMQKTNISTPNGIFMVQNGTKRYVPTYDDYLWLGINSANTMTISIQGTSKITPGPTVLRDSALFSVSGSSNVYVVNAAASSFYVPTSEMLTDFNFDWNTFHDSLGATVLSVGYPSAGTLTRWVKVNNGNLSYVSNKKLITISSSAAANWGINLSSTSSSSVSGAMASRLTSQPLGRFVSDKSTGKVYYGNNGTYQYITSYSTYVALGGLKEPLVSVSPDFFSGLTQGSNL